LDTYFKTVILSGVAASRSEAAAESKDLMPVWTTRNAVRRSLDGVGP